MNGTEHRQVTIRGVPVVFPFEPYPTQREYMGSVITALQGQSNALLESPTGTGKTLSLLCAVLGWLRARKQSLDATRSAADGIPPIFYCSRTHSQIAQVIREFKRTVYADDCVMAVLGSREHLCVHTQVTGLPAHNQGFQCAQLRTDNNCRFFRGTAKYMASEAKDAATQVIRNVNLHDIEDIGAVGRQENFCPYFYEREMAVSADIIFLPYTYILDRSMHSQLPRSLEGAIVIVDEAHNVPSALTSAGSHTLAPADFAAALRDMDAIMGMMEVRMLKGAGELGITWHDKRGGGGGSTANDDALTPHEFLGLAAAAKLLLAKLEAGIEALEMNASAELERSGLFAFELLADAGITRQAYRESRRHLRGVLATAAQLLSGQSELLTSSANGSAIGKVNAFLDAVLDSGLSESETDECCRFILQRDEAGHRTMSFWCLDISVPMKSLCANLRQVLLTSGTLSPMDHFGAELGVGFDVTYQSRHVINVREQLRSCILKCGPTGATLNGSYAFRTSREYYGALGASIVNLAVIVPDGMLVFFPSYASMNTTVAAWKAPPAGEHEATVWGQLSEHKSIFVEPTTTAELPALIAEYQEAATRRKGAILFGVARGKISEGVDFADRHARCVIVTGIPFANSSDIFVRIKRNFLTRISATRPKINGKAYTGDDWYKNEAIRSVNQCVGRVIRHHNDYGCVVLADERFAAHVQALSSWITRDEHDAAVLATPSSFGECFSWVATFFRSKATGAQRGSYGTHVAPSTEQPALQQVGPNASSVTAEMAQKALAHHRTSTNEQHTVGPAPVTVSALPVVTAVHPGSPLTGQRNLLNLFGKDAPTAPAITAMVHRNPPNEAKVVDSKTLIAQLKADLPPPTYQAFRGHLEALVRLRKQPTTAPADDSVRAIIVAIVNIFCDGLTPPKAATAIAAFKWFVGPYTGAYDKAVEERHATRQ